MTQSLPTPEPSGDATPLNAPKVRLKVCTKCGERKPLDQFGAHATATDGRQSYCKGCRNQLHVKRRKVDLDHRVRHHFTTRITEQLKHNPPEGIFKNLETYLGYSLARLRIELNRDIQGREGISFRAALEAGYHIDHIKPLSAFQPSGVDDPQFRECWAISNLRLISAEENLAKGSRWADADADAAVEGNNENDD